MKLGKNRFHKEETQRQGTTACTCPRSSHLAAPATEPRLSGVRLSCDWPEEPRGRGLASHWLAEEPGPDRGPAAGGAVKAEDVDGTASLLVQTPH